MNKDYVLMTNAKFPEIPRWKRDLVEQLSYLQKYLNEHTGKNYKIEDVMNEVILEMETENDLDFADYIFTYMNLYSVYEQPGSLEIIDDTIEGTAMFLRTLKGIYKCLGLTLPRQTSVFSSLIEERKNKFTVVVG